MAEAEFQKRRIVCVLGERDAPASFMVEGVLAVKIGEEEITKPHTRPATAEEVRQIFGDGHAQQLVNIDMLTQRMAEQQQEAAAQQQASAKETRELHDALAKKTAEASAIEEKYRKLLELNRLYDKAAAEIDPPQSAA